MSCRTIKKIENLRSVEQKVKEGNHDGRNSEEKGLCRKGEIEEKELRRKIHMGSGKGR